MSEQSNRREFLQKSAMTAAAMTAVGAGGAKARAAGNPVSLPEPKREAVLKLSAQEGRVAGANLDEQLDNMEKMGFEGLEPGGRGLPGRVKDLKNKLKGRPIRISAICAGFEGWIIADNKEIRDKAMGTMKEILNAAGELGSTGLIIVPAFNRQKSLPHKQARQLLTGFARWDKKDRKREGALLQELGDHAVRAGTRILLEPLNREECYFLRTLADAASICKDLENPGIAVLGDFWHMTWEETSDLGAILSAGDYLHHIHMASRRRRVTPGEDGEADDYVEGFKGLKLIGYQDYVSLECGAVGDKNVVVPACAKLLRDQWAKA